LNLKKIYKRAERKYIQMIPLKGSGKVLDSRRSETLKAFRSKIFGYERWGRGYLGLWKQGSIGGSGL
jgi:hypothetical protein